MSNQLNLPRDKDLAKQLLDNHNEIELTKVNQGKLGSLWGNSNNVGNNIAALLVLILLFLGICYTLELMNSKVDDISLTIKDFWAIISPLITLAVGYLFGNKKLNI